MRRLIDEDAVAPAGLVYEAHDVEAKRRAQLMAGSASGLRVALLRR